MKIGIAELEIHLVRMLREILHGVSGSMCGMRSTAGRMSMNLYPSEVAFYATDAGAGTAADGVPRGKRTEGSTRKEIRLCREM